MELLKATKISKSYKSRTDEITQVLLNLDLVVNQRDFISIQGVSGSGKSTLLHIIGGLDQPDNGTVTIFNNDNIDLYKQSDKILSKIRNTFFGFVFQFHHLLPEFTSIENVAMPALIGGLEKKQAYQKSELLLEKVGMKEKMHKKPTTLSGGEQQRVAIARALINNPKIVLADEPTGNLDAANSNQFLELTMSLIAEFDTTFIIATHSVEIAENATRKYLLKNGNLETLS